MSQIIEGNKNSAGSPSKVTKQVNIELLKNLSKEDEREAEAELAKHRGEPTQAELNELRNIQSLLTRDPEFDEMPYYVFHGLIKNDKIKKQVIASLPTGGKNFGSADELGKWIEHCDKDQFKKYASGLITFSQFKK